MKFFEPVKIGKFSINNRVLIVTMQEIADTMGKYLPQVLIAFDWDRSEEMKAANIYKSYDVDNTATREDFGW